MSIDEAIAQFERERDAIWLQQPEEIRVLSEGTHPRGIGSRGQYLTPIMFAEGAARSFADETLWSIMQYCDRPDMDFTTVRAVAVEMSARKAGFFELFGLEHFSHQVQLYADTAAAAQTPEDLKRLTAAMASYANRVHVWLDAAFPWGVCSGFMRKAFGTRNAEGREG